tara:strand:- start:7060 stop:7686 length:627 start_codon:yes stop_codon:yes gene_type:complete
MNFLEKIGIRVIFTVLLFFSYSIIAETKKLLILGDSISAGYGIDVSANWVSLLQNEFDKENLNITLINSSVSGDTSIGGLSRIKTALRNFNPEFVLIELGGNDALRGYPPKNIENNLSEIIKEVKKNGSKPFLMQIRIPPNYGKQYTIAFESVFQDLAKKENIPLIPFMLDEIALDKDLMQVDGIHPNTKAQPKIAVFLKKELISLLK